MKSAVKWIALTVGVLALGAGIGRAIVARKAQQAELSQTAAAVQAKLIQLAPQDVWVVQPQALSRGIAVSGGLSAQRSAVVKAKVAAELLTLTVREGERVKQGQVIATLDPQEFDLKLKQARQQAASAQAQLQIAQQTLSSNQALVQQGFISKNTLDTSVSNQAAAQANLAAAQAVADLNLKSLKDATVRAPISGLISQRFAQVGERVSVDARLVEIVDLGSLELQAALSPQELAQISVGTPAQLQVEGVNGMVPARVARINPSAASDTRAVMVYLTLPAHPGLRQGLFAQGQIQLASNANALVVPASAVARDAGTDQVLRVREGRVARVAVQLGERGQLPSKPAQTWVSVTSGLAPGDVVLVDAAGTVREGAAVALPAASAASASKH